MTSVAKRIGQKTLKRSQLQQVLQILITLEASNASVAIDDHLLYRAARDGGKSANDILLRGASPREKYSASRKADHREPLLRVFQFPCVKGVFLPYLLLQEAQRRLQSGTWTHDYVYFTGAGSTCNPWSIQQVLINDTSQLPPCVNERVN